MAAQGIGSIIKDQSSPMARHGHLETFVRLAKVTFSTQPHSANHFFHVKRHRSSGLPKDIENEVLMINQTMFANSAAVSSSWYAMDVGHVRSVSRKVWWVTVDGLDVIKVSLPNLESEDVYGLLKAVKAEVSPRLDKVSMGELKLFPPEAGRRSGQKKEIPKDTSISDIAGGENAQVPFLCVSYQMEPRIERNDRYIKDYSKSTCEKMPLNMWGSTILSTLMYRSWISGEWRLDGECIIVCGLQFFGLCSSIAIQWVLIQFLGQLAEARHFPVGKDDNDNYFGKCNQSDERAIFACTLVLNAIVLSIDIRETVGMLQFINKIPLWNEGEHRDKYTKDDSKAALVVTLVAKGDNEEKIGKPETGITWFHTLFIYSLLILKTLITLLLQGTSYDFIMYTEESTEILLNCTATLFICEVDEVCFKIVNSSALQRLFAEYPAFEADTLKDVLGKWSQWCCKCCRCSSQLQTDETKDRSSRRSSMTKVASMPWFETALYSGTCPIFTVYGAYELLLLRWLCPLQGESGYIYFALGPILVGLWGRAHRSALLQRRDNLGHCVDSWSMCVDSWSLCLDSWSLCVDSCVDSWSLPTTWTYGQRVISLPGGRASKGTDFSHLFTLICLTWLATGGD